MRSSPLSGLTRWFTLPPWLVLVLSLIAALNLVKVGLRPFTPDRPVDFRAVYTGARLLLTHRDPYPDANLRTAWQEIVRAEHLTSRTTPGTVGAGESFLYPPWAAALLAGAVAWIPFGIAYPLWYLLSLAALLLACRWWPAIIASWGGPKPTYADLLLVALALKGTVASLLVGQPTFVAFALGTGALEAARRGRPAWAGGLLGLAAFKITLALPFAALLLLRPTASGRLQLLAAGGAVGLALTLVAIRLHPAGWALLPAYGQMTSQVREFVFNPANPAYPLGYQMITLFELGTLLDWLHPGAWRWLTLVYAALGAGVAGWAWTRRRTLDPLTGWVVAALLALLTTYHLFYDALLLLPLVAWARTISGRRALVLLAVATPLFLPVNAILDALHSPLALRGLYFTLPLSAVGLLLVVLTASARLGSAGRNALAA